MFDCCAYPSLRLPKAQPVIPVGKFVEAIEVLLGLDLGAYFRTNYSEPLAELAPGGLDQKHVSTLWSNVHLVPMVTGQPRKLPFGRGNYLPFLVGPSEVNSYRTLKHEERLVLNLVHVGKRPIIWRPRNLGDQQVEARLVSFRMENHLGLDHLRVENIHVYKFLARRFVRLALYSVGVDFVEVEAQGRRPFVTFFHLAVNVGADICSAEPGTSPCKSPGAMVTLIDASSDVRPARVSTARSASSSENVCVHIFSNGYFLDSISRSAGS